MIKLIAFTMALLLILPISLFACGKTDDNPPEQDDSPAPSDDHPSTDDAKARVALDLTKEWETLNGENTLVQGCLVINTAWAAEHLNEVAKFLADYKGSVESIKSGNDEAINTIVNAGILPKAGIAKQALPNCNLCYVAGNEMKPMMNAFCEKIFDYDPKSIGGKMPTDAFYYTSSGDASLANKELEMKIYALNGTTALGMAEMICAVKDGNADMNYNISLHADATAITGAIVKGECAIAALPTNVAVKLFNASEGKLQLLALNTLGVLYLLQDATQNITSIHDLKGKTIYVPGAGANPEYITAAFLTAAGLKIGVDVMLDTATYNTPDALQTAFSTGKAPLAVLPEPKVTVALNAANAAK
jgi:ABC-type nitrate/sulfonate/bicarbonate transport system substrate-binding protein